MLDLTTLFQSCVFRVPPWHGGSQFYKTYWFCSKVPSPTWTHASPVMRITSLSLSLVAVLISPVFAETVALQPGQTIVGFNQCQEAAGPSRTPVLFASSSGVCSCQDKTDAVAAGTTICGELPRFICS